jgi:uncharacterized membrane protein
MRENWTDARVENLLGNLLRLGVVLAAAVVLAGGTVFLARHGTEPPPYHVFRGEPTDLRSVGGIVGDVFNARGRGLIQFGLLLLIATPVARVVLSALIFAAERDKRYVVFTLVVLAVLIYSLLTPYI